MKTFEEILNEELEIAGEDDNVQLGDIRPSVDRAAIRYANQQIALLKASLATTENQYRLSQKEESDTFRELEVVKAERDELQKEYETLIMEKDELSKNYTQIGENLSYYIGLSDRYYHEAEELRVQGTCNLERFNQIIVEKDLQISSQEVEIKDMKQEITLLMAERAEMTRLCEFMVETVAREGWNARHTESGEFEEWWWKRQVVI